MLGTSFSSYWISLDYVLNKKYIAANLCENKGRPAMKCEGKCYLCKKIRKENSKDADNSSHKGTYKFQLLSTGLSFTWQGGALFNASHSFTSYKDDLPASPVGTCFHPPQLVSA